MKNHKNTVWVLTGLIFTLVLAFLVSSKLSKDSPEPVQKDSEKLASSGAVSSKTNSQSELSEREKNLKTLLSMTDAELIAWGKDFGENDPLFGLEIAAGLDKDSPEYELFLNALFTAWAEVDAVGSVKHLLTLWNDEDDFQFAKFIDIPAAVWGKEDPAGVAALFPEFISFGEDDLGKSRHGSYVLDLILKNWAESSPEESLSWLLAQPDFGKIDRFLSTIIGQWAGQDPLEALAQISLFPEGSEEIGVIKNAAIEVWAEGDVSAAVEWAMENISDGEFEAVRDAADKVAQELFLQESGDAAVEWVDFISDEHARKSALMSLLFVWAGAEEPLTMLDAFESKVVEGEGEEGAALYETELVYAAEQIAYRDPTEVANWLNDHGELNAATDKVAEGLIDALESDHPDAAYLWADTIQDEKLRDEMVYYTLTNWGHSDHEALSEWLTNSENVASIPEDLVEELNQIVELEISQRGQ